MKTIEPIKSCQPFKNIQTWKIIKDFGYIFSQQSFSWRYLLFWSKNFQYIYMLYE